MTDENFYATFTDRHRGARELVKHRLEASYLPFVGPLKQLYPDCPALDLGCGRGEWLELLEEHGLAPYGVDLDEGMLAACRERGFTVEKQDAVSAFSTLSDESLVVVSGFHIVEHIPFEALQILMREAMRVLKPGGMLILETPNPENILVSTSGFFLDPTHQRPIPLHLLAFLSEYYGFARTKVLRLHESPEMASKPVITLQDVFEGVSPDYAIIAQKPCSEEQMAVTDPPFTLERGLMLDALTSRYDHQAEARFSQIEARFTREEARIAQTEVRIAQTEAGIVRAEARAIMAETDLQALYLSRSWRLTKPLRNSVDIMRRARGGAGLIMRKIRSRLGALRVSLLSAAARVFLSNRVIQRYVLPRIKRFPRLEARLRRAVAFVEQAKAPPQADPRIMASAIPPSARRIHAELVAAIERRDGKQG